MSAEIYQYGLFDETQTNSLRTSRDSSPLEAKLKKVDWSFESSARKRDIDGIHPYPTKFINELPRALLKILSPPLGSVVFDPFCGSGTTLTECQREGVASIGVDLNPIACLISRVKTQPIADGFSKTLDAVLNRGIRDHGARIPDIPNLDHWFLKSVQCSLASLTHSIALANPAHQDILRVALSSVIVRVSNQESDTRYAAVKKSVREAGVFKLFARAAQRTAEALQNRNYELTRSRTIEADILTLGADKIGTNVGLVITSPPYPNAYEYWLYHKYRMWWLGLDPLAVKEKEIGARAHFFKRDHHTAADFIRQMETTFALLKQVMIPGAYACFVIGRSRIHGEIIDNGKIIEKTAAGMGFRLVFLTERVLAATRKSFNLSHANIKTEKVLIFKK